MKICFLNGVRNGELVELSGEEISLGREVDNDIIIETEGVSRYHAKLFKKSDGTWILEDLDSTNGCKVNKNLIDGEQLLKAGDIINIGDQDFRMDEGKSKSEAKSTASPVIQTVKEPVRQTVKKIVFQPISKKTEKAPKVLIETVKSKTVAEKTKAEPQKSPTVTAKELSENVDNIFGEQKNNSKTDKKSKEPVARKHIFNAMFYLMLLLGVVVFVFLFLNSNKEIETANIVHGSRAQKIPLVLSYVKTEITKNNIFRFSLLIENNTATFIIDDAKADRHHNQIIKEIKPEFIKALKSAIEDSRFMKLPPVSRGSAVNSLDKTRTMTIALDKKINSITVQNNSAPTSFEDIEMAIMDFTDSYDLLTFAMPPKELQKRAIESFAKAEQYYDNRKANSGNLLEAERRYKLTIDYLNQFSSKPKFYDIAKKRYDEVKSMRKKRWKELHYEVDRLERLGKLQEGIEALNEMLLLAYEDDKVKKWVRKKITKFSRTLNARNK